MSASDDYCDLCDLPKSQCVHGRPPAPPPPRATAATRPSTRSTTPRRPATKASASTPPAKPVRLRWTPPEAFKPLIVTVLQQAGGELEAQEVFAELATLTEGQLRPQDSETTPEGELRWQYAARRARVALIDEGVMTKSRPGVWQLS